MAWGARRPACIVSYPQRRGQGASAAAGVRFAGGASGAQRQAAGEKTAARAGRAGREASDRMRVLDIDLDFFLEDCCPLAAPGARPALEGHAPWEPERVEAFLERQCGLSAAAPAPGAVFETHDGALRFWQARLRDGTLTQPFHVTHVDAHSDLGIGYPGPGYVLNGVLPQRVAVRPDPERYAALHELDEANYLLFALAFRWVASLDNVRNDRSRPDVPPEILLPGRRDVIRLSSFPARLMERENGPEPAVPFAVYDDYRTFVAAAPYDFVTLAVSPRYAPAAADALIPVIARYLRPVG